MRRLGVFAGCCCLLVLGGCRKGEEIPGDPANFDPIEQFGAVESYVGEPYGLVSLRVSSMRQTGTLDLTTKAYNPHAEYQFQAETKAPSDAPPPGASGSSSDGRWHAQVGVSLWRKGKSWHVTERSANVTREYTVITRGMLASEPKVNPGGPGPSLPPPKCSFGALWKKVDPGNLPADAVLDGSYNQSGYEIRDPVHSQTYKFDHDCEPVSR
jgi:hypothetical protein